MTPEAYCEQRAARSGSSFYYSFRFLPARQRQAITALYAFCREVDDVVDECSEPALAAIKLKWWSDEVERIFAGRPQHPVGQALAPHVAACGLPRAPFDEIIRGMAQDLVCKRYPDFATLADYCYLAAGTVGILAAHIFGFRAPATLDYARDLGTALQLTNILRDVREDAARDRIYLPQDELERFAVSEAEVLGNRWSERFRDLLAFQAERARGYYDKALAELPASDRASQRAGLVMAAIYRSVLDEIAGDGYRVLEQRVHLTPLRKLWIAWSTVRRERRLARAA